MDTYEKIDPPFPFFRDIGYTYYDMPLGSSVEECYRILLNGDKQEFFNKEISDWTEIDFKDYLNEYARVQILSFLENEKTWTDDHYRLLAYVILPLDLYSSAEEFQKLYDLCLRCKNGSAS